ncbi:MAG: hypothetical protein NTU44_04215 [Bacteroidetes bacterium]|nr:hypothetical protein [Bacteroidota bacterium]
MRKLYKQLAIVILITQFLVLTSTPSFGQWQQTGTPSSTNNADAFATLGSSVYAGTWGSGIYVTSNEGTTWTQNNAGLTNLNVTSLVVEGADIYAGTYQGGIYKSTDAGASWAPSGLSSLWINCFEVIGTEIYCGTMNNGIYVSSDNGASWLPRNNGLPLNSGVRDFCVNGTHIFAAINDSVFLSSNNGSNWTSVCTGLPSTSCYSLAVYGGNILLGTQSYGIFESTNNGSSWTDINNGNWFSELASILVLGMNIYIGTSDGIFFSSDNGASWTAINDGLTFNADYCLSLTVSGVYMLEGCHKFVWRRPVSEITSIGVLAGTTPEIKVLNANSGVIEFNYYPKSPHPTYSIYSATGQLLEKGSLDNSETHEIRLKNIQRGIYLLNIADCEYSRTQKIGIFQ